MRLIKVSTPEWMNFCVNSFQTLRYHTLKLFIMVDEYNFKSIHPRQILAYIVFVHLVQVSSSTSRAPMRAETKISRVSVIKA